jgi:predicted peroxiredoxin
MSVNINYFDLLRNCRAGGRKNRRVCSIHRTTLLTLYVKRTDQLQEERKMTNNVVITVSCGTDNPNRATRAIHLATVAHREGKNVTLFLLDEAIYLAKKGLLDNLRAATGDVADDLMTYLQAHGVPVLACTPCAKARGVTENDLIDGARMGTAIELIHLACDATVISL